MKQIQKLLKRTIRTERTGLDKDQKILQTSHYLAIKRRRFVAETPIGFKPRSSSDFFLQN